MNKTLESLNLLRNLALNLSERKILGGKKQSNSNSKDKQINFVEFIYD